MSKSLGNVIDLMETIAQYGSDALRMGIVSGRVPAVNRPYDFRRIEEARNFSNKIWNIARYIEGRVGDNQHLRTKATPQTPVDHWILNKLSITTREVSRALEHFRLGEAYEFIYHFVWHDLADWYVEASKVGENVGFLAYVLEVTLKLVHPYAPFVTETIWQTLSWDDGTFLAAQPWPKINNASTEEAQKFEDIIDIIAEARHIINVLRLKKPHLYYNYSDTVVAQLGLIIKLAGLGGVGETKDSQQRGLRLTSSGKYACWLEVRSETAKVYLDKLMQEHHERLQTIGNLKKRLSNKSYTEKAPKEIVEQTKAQLAEEQTSLATLEEELNNFKTASRNI